MRRMSGRGDDARALLVAFLNDVQGLAHFLKQDGLPRLLGFPHFHRFAKVAERFDLALKLADRLVDPVLFQRPGAPGLLLQFQAAFLHRLHRSGGVLAVLRKQFVDLLRLKAGVDFRQLGAQFLKLLALRFQRARNSRQPLFQFGQQSLVLAAFFVQPIHPVFQVFPRHRVPAFFLFFFGHRLLPPGLYPAHRSPPME
jgi:hypothetical protein